MENEKDLLQIDLTAGKIETFNLGEHLRIADSVQIVPTQLAFTCQICGEAQPFYGSEKIIFPICDQCKKDLKEFVLSKRNKPE